jgi:peroxiredoxin
MVQPGHKIGGVRLVAGDGQTVPLRDLLERGPVALAFFKVSCPTCQYTFPFLDRLAGSDALQVVGVSQDTQEATEQFREAFGLRMPLLLDPADEGYGASNAFGIAHVPSVFVVRPDGHVSHAFNGFSRSGVEELGRTAGVSVFREGERTPDFRPG